MWSLKFPYNPIFNWNHCVQEGLILKHERLTVEGNINPLIPQNEKYSCFFSPEHELTGMGVHRRALLKKGPGLGNSGPVEVTGPEVNVWEEVAGTEGFFSRRESWPSPWGGLRRMMWGKWQQLCFMFCPCLTVQQTHLLPISVQVSVFFGINPWR